MKQPISLAIAYAMKNSALRRPLTSAEEAKTVIGSIPLKKDPKSLAAEMVQKKTAAIEPAEDIESLDLDEPEAFLDEMDDVDLEDNDPIEEGQLSKQKEILKRIFSSL